MTLRTVCRSPLTRTAPDAISHPVLSIHNLNVWYGERHALRDVSIAISRHKITALIGPSGCGKSTFLRCLNRYIRAVVTAHRINRYFF